MDDKIVIENFDFVINNLTARNGFSINNELFDKFNPESPTERKHFLDLCDEIREFGLRNGYLIQIGKPANNSGYFNLTEKGLDLKNFGKGHLKFVKKLNSKPLDWYKIIPIILTIVFGSVSAYFLKANYDLKLNELNLREINDSLIKNNGNLKNQLLIYKDSLVEMQEKLNGHALKPLSTTSKTKNPTSEIDVGMK
ncbi:hypothetical protein [Pseudozobellia sp. WGM2]|uniref:hypothetical protein n=1 Tax=Pseudozobellia sp. WGM2 TaxID=2787625 RepID=UPI001AE082E7|nr:hypothetical protein [Pseudozobellia sp. WGM2]